MRLAPLFFALVLAVALQGCGIRGPLYLPDQQPSAKKKAEPHSAQDQEQK